MCLKYWLHRCVRILMRPSSSLAGITYARTLEKSGVGDMTKLSSLFDQDMR